MKVFVASARGPATDQYRKVAIQVIEGMRDADGHKWTAIRMEDDAYTEADPAPSTGGYFTTADWGPNKVKQCDAMVVIAGWKYGSLVPEERISYTTKEYRTALADNVRVFAWVLRSEQEPEPQTRVEQDMLIGLYRELQQDPDHGESAAAFVQEIRTNNHVISNDLPLDLENEGGFRIRLKNVLVSLQQELAARQPASRSSETVPGRDEVIGDGVRATAAADRVTLTWESTFQHDRENIRALSTSWSAPRTTVLAVRRTGDEAGYVVLRSDVGVTIVRMRQDGIARTVDLDVPFPVNAARLGRGAELGTLTLQSAAGQVSVIRTDELRFGEAWSADVGTR